MASKAGLSKFRKAIAALINEMDAAPAGAELTWLRPFIERVEKSAQAIGLAGPLSLWRESHTDGYERDRLDLRSPFGTLMKLIILWQQLPDGTQSGTGKLTGEQRAEVLYVLEQWRRHADTAKPTPPNVDWIIEHRGKKAPPAGVLPRASDELHETQRNIIEAISTAKHPLTTREEVATAAMGPGENKSEFRRLFAQLKSRGVIVKRHDGYKLSGQCPDLSG